jgi:hypothetical protein
MTDPSSSDPMHTSLLMDYILGLPQNVEGYTDQAPQPEFLNDVSISTVRNMGPFS